MNWLITGGCGFIGLNLINKLVEEGGHYIRIVDNLSIGTRQDLSQVCSFTESNLKLHQPEFSLISLKCPPQPLVFDISSASHETKPFYVNSELCAIPGKVDLIVADILDAQIALKVAEEIDIIVHLAANTGVDPSVKDPRSDCLNNIVGTLNYLEAARCNNINRFIFASSGAPVGECEPPIHEEIVPHPVSPYGASKLSGEAYCSAYFRTYGVETVALRFGNVYGPLSGQKNSVVAKFIKRIMASKPLEIYGDGTQTRDFIFIEDLIKAILLSTNSKHIGGEIFQIATSKETSINELTEELYSVVVDFGFKKSVKIFTEPHSGEVKRNFSDTSKAEKLLGWRAKISLREGLRRTVEWFLNAGKKDLDPKTEKK